jgi:hypothetical protein
MHSVYILADYLSFLEFSSRAVSLGGWVSRNGWCVFHNFCSQIVAMRFVSQLWVFQLLWSGPVLFSYNSCWGLVQVTGLFIVLSYVHHVDCAYINSPEKVDDSCSWSARSILQLLRQLIEGPVSIGQRPGRTFETCMIYELEKMWTSESTQFAWIW